MIYKFNFIERILLNRDIIPHPFMDSTINAGLTKALAVAVKIGIADHLTTEYQPAKNIARKCEIDEKAACWC